MTKIRAFRWADLDAYARLVREAAPADGAPSPFTEADAGEYLRQPNLTPERDCFLAEAQGQVVGYALVVPELKIWRVIIEGAVGPAFRRRGIGGRLLDRAVRHGKSLGAERAHVSIAPAGVAAQRLLASRGFAEVRRQRRMRLDPDRGGRSARGEGYRVRSLLPGEAALMTDLQNRAFAGSWGFCPNVPEEVDYRLRMRGSSYQDVLVLEAEGVPAAYCWTKTADRAGERVGIIWMIGSVPEARGRGLGRAMLLEGMDYLKSRGAGAIELTVYADNTAAVRLYEATGFRTRGDIIFYEKALQGPVN